jgi:hypothetical protein
LKIIPTELLWAFLVISNKTNEMDALANKSGDKDFFSGNNS